MSLNELVEYVYDDLNPTITGFDGDTSALEIVVDYDETFQGRPLVATIQCRDVRECTLHPETFAELSQPADHPLLWQHVQSAQALYFSSAPQNSFELLGRLYSAHNELFGGWRLPSDYIYASAEILDSGSGQLADGPQAAIETYYAIAERFLRCSLVTVFERKGADKILLFDDSFVIAREIQLATVTPKSG